VAELFFVPVASSCSLYYFSYCVSQFPVRAAFWRALLAGEQSGLSSQFAVDLFSRWLFVSQLAWEQTPLSTDTAQLFTSLIKPFALGRDQPDFLLPERNKPVFVSVATEGTGAVAATATSLTGCVCSQGGGQSHQILGVLPP